MARLVDRLGNPLTPDAVRAIEYSVYSLCESSLYIKEALVDHFERQLLVHEVILPRLRRRRPWDVDDHGYNFRHRIKIDRRNGSFVEKQTHYEIRYVITEATGEQSVVRFRVRMVPND
jgi:hypothetical protein